MFELLIQIHFSVSRNTKIRALAGPNNEKPIVKTISNVATLTIRSYRNTKLMPKVECSAVEGLQTNSHKG